MELKVEDANGIKIYSLSVEHIDAGNYEEVEQLFMGEFDSSGEAVLDLENVEFIDSSGIGVILYCIRQLDQQGRELRIANTNETIRSAFKLIRIDRLARICGSRSEAIDDIKT